MRREFSDIGDGLEAASQFLKQERRFFREQHPVAAADTAALDARLEQHQQQILRESSERNELGLYRNASMTLGCLALSRDDYDAALDYFLDVAFLELSGARNSLPGYPSFDPSLSLLVPFVAAVLRDIYSTLELQPQEAESFFRERAARFSSFGTPGVPHDTAWRTLQAAIST